MLPDEVRDFRKHRDILRQHGAKRGQEMFSQTETYRGIQREFPDTASSLLTQFEHPRAEETIVKLERIPNDSPNCDLTALSRLQVPALVLANRSDPIHPFEYGRILVRAIPNAEFNELTAKSVSLERHEREVQQFIVDFLRKHFLARFGSG